MKSLKITEETHKELKSYCKKNSLKMNLYVENLIKKTLYCDKREESECQNR